MVATAAAQQPRIASDYETIYILRPDSGLEEAEKVATRAAEVISRLGGKITKVDNWGKRKLAYMIKKHTRGIFVYIRFVGYDDLVAELQRNFRLLDSIVRFQTILLERHVDMDAIEVDPEEVKFLHIEPGEEEEEDERLEQRLGLAESRPRASAQHDAAGRDQAAPEDASASEGEAKEVVAAPEKASASEGEAKEVVAAPEKASASEGDAGGDAPAEDSDAGEEK